VGLVSADTPGIQSWRIGYDRALQTHLIEQDGWVELFYDEGERVVGGYAVGPQAADVASQIALAMRSGITLQQLADVFVAHPTLSELLFIAARDAVGY
jgi:dihydrolipoamide dehydrogenase